MNGVTCYQMPENHFPAHIRHQIMDRPDPFADYESASKHYVALALANLYA
jgi:hypothetical protein